MQAGGDVVASVGEVERCAVQVTLDQAEEVALFGVLDEVGIVGGPVDGEDGKVGCGVDGGTEHGGDFGALGDDDQVVGCQGRTRGQLRKGDACRMETGSD